MRRMRYLNSKYKSSGRWRLKGRRVSSHKSGGFRRTGSGNSQYGMGSFPGTSFLSALANAFNLRNKSIVKTTEGSS